MSNATATAILSSKGQITIPQLVREKLGVRTGDRIEFVEIADEQFALRPVVEDVRSLKGFVPKLSEPLSIGDMHKIVAKRGGGN